MKKAFMMMFLAVGLFLFPAACFAGNSYPDTLDNGNLVLVDAHMGTGVYVDRSSVVVQKYAPPNYQLAINTIAVTFSDTYWKEHQTYLNGPYTMGKVITQYFRYNWDRKAVAHYNSYTGSWRAWNIHRDNCHADGNPFVPNAAETAFVAAYHMRFFNHVQGYSPMLKKSYRVISDDFYRLLGV